MYLNNFEFKHLNTYLQYFKKVFLTSIYYYIRCILLVRNVSEQLYRTYFTHFTRPSVHDVGTYYID